MPQKGYRKPNAKKRSVRQRAYQGKTEQRKNRSSRNKARRKLKSCAGKDVHHRDGNPKNNKRSNLVCMSKRKNRSKK
jgi:hypothetical protein